MEIKLVCHVTFWCCIWTGHISHISANINIYQYPIIHTTKLLTIKHSTYKYVCNTDMNIKWIQVMCTCTHTCAGHTHKNVQTEAMLYFLIKKCFADKEK